MELADHEWEALRAVIHAGADGVRLGRDVAISTSVRLEMLGLARIGRSADGAQTVTATSKGASAFRQRRFAA